MKYLKLFESFNSDTYIDYLVVRLKNEDDDIIFKQSNDNSIFIQVDTENNLDNYLNGVRFNNKDVVTKWRTVEFPQKDRIYDIFICNTDFYNRNKKYHIENIKWEDHPLVTKMRGLHNITSPFGIEPFLPESWKLIKLSDDVTATLNINHKNEVEFWDKSKTDEPIFFNLDETPYFQFLLLDSLGR
jgi:hypothetical protein